MNNSKPMHPILRQLGLSPELIGRHVLRVEPPLSRTQIQKLLSKSTEAQRRRRASFIAQGLNSQGKPRRRSPNGTRKVYIRKKR